MYGTLRGALAGRKIEFDRETYTAAVEGRIAGVGKTIRITSIHVHYQLAVPAGAREAALRALAVHPEDRMMVAVPVHDRAPIESGQGLHARDVLHEVGERPRSIAQRRGQRVVREEPVQLVGGKGALAEHVVDRLYRAVRALRIYEGTTEIQQLIIAGELLK